MDSLHTFMQSRNVYAWLEYSLTFMLRNQLVAGNNFRITNWRMENGEWRMGNGEWGMENCCAAASFSILHSPFFFREEIELRQSQSPSRSSASFPILHSPFFLFVFQFFSYHWQSLTRTDPSQGAAEWHSSNAGTLSLWAVISYVPVSEFWDQQRCRWP